MFSEWIAASIVMKLKSFALDRTGSIALGFGLAFIPILVAAGVALDYSKASNAQTQFKAILDAAALSGVRSSTVLQTVGKATQKEELVELVRRDFVAQVDSRPDLLAMLKDVKTEGTITGEALTINLCYIATVNTGFVRFVGITTMQMKGCAQAVTPLPSYVSIHALVDASGSMGIGASTDDQSVCRRGSAAPLPAIRRTGASRSIRPDAIHVTSGRKRPTASTASEPRPASMSYAKRSLK